MEILEQSETRMMEAEFLAEDEMITMLPLVSIPRMTFLQGDYGPLIPGEPIEVPIWFALALKRARKCKLVVPSWMEEKQLEKTVENERISKNRLTPVPYYYAEIASLLLHYASDDMRSAATVRRGVEDLTSLRSSKFRRYLQINVREDCNGIKIENICSGELSTIRPVLCEILETIHRANNSGEVNPIKVRKHRVLCTQPASHQVILLTGPCGTSFLASRQPSDAIAEISGHPIHLYFLVLEATKFTSISRLTFPRRFRTAKRMISLLWTEIASPPLPASAYWRLPRPIVDGCIVLTSTPSHETANIHEDVLAASRRQGRRLCLEAFQEKYISFA